MPFTFTSKVLESFGEEIELLLHPALSVKQAIQVRSYYAGRWDEELAACSWDVTDAEPTGVR